MSESRLIQKKAETLEARLDVSAVEDSPLKNKLTESSNHHDSLISLQSEDFKMTLEHFEKLKVAEFCCLTLAIFGFACAAICSDISYSAGQRATDDVKMKILMNLCSVSTGLLLVAVVWRTMQELKWQQAKAIYSYQDGLISTGKYLTLSFELLINIVHAPYGSQNVQVSHYVVYRDVTIEYQLNSILVVAMLIRFYHIVRLFSSISDFRSCRAQRICQMNGVYSSTFFAVKCLVKDKPLEVIAFMLLVGIFAGSFCYRIFERPLDQHSGFPFSDYGSCMWLVIITMTTVGYGDMYPSTTPGRFCGVIVCVWGILLVSMMIVAISSVTDLEMGEDKAFLILRRLRFREELRNAAAYVLTSAMNYRFKLKKGLKSKIQLNVLLGKFRRHINAFQRLRLQQRTLYDYDSPEDRLEQKLNEALLSNQTLKAELQEIKALIIRGNSK